MRCQALAPESKRRCDLEEGHEYGHRHQDENGITYWHDKPHYVEFSTEETN